MFLHRVQETLARQVNIDSLISKRGPVRDLITLIESHGWVWVRTKGSHHMWKHAAMPDTIVLNYTKLGDTLAIGVVVKSLKSAGLR